MGPLAGLKVIELGGIGPVPFAAMLLADMGATVIRVDRVGEVGTGDRATDPLLRNRQSVAVNLKDPDGAAVILRMVERADALIEGFRPGVAERLGLGPPECLETNPALVYGRMTGWGQEGPLAASAGHDLNYLALAGVLGMIGPAGGAPTVPLNLIADFGGGGMLLALGVLGAVLESRSSGRGQVVDAAMVDGAALLSTMIHGFRAQGLWTDERGANLLDGGAPFYGVYETADGEFLTIAPIEPAFFGELVERVGLTGEVPDQFDQSGWPELRRRLEEAFAARTLAEWQETLEGTDVCFAPVLSID
ncbi:MAG: CoA transferase, partial [Acidimicrobiia bacterium]|nr:CoA transferase [Acidimicrobiia bacterium]